MPPYRGMIWLWLIHQTSMYRELRKTAHTHIHRHEHSQLSLWGLHGHISIHIYRCSQRIAYWHAHRNISSPTKDTHTVTLSHWGSHRNSLRNSLLKKQKAKVLGTRALCRSRNPALGDSHILLPQGQLGTDPEPCPPFLKGGPHTWLKTTCGIGVCLGWCR